MCANTIDIVKNFAVIKNVAVKSFTVLQSLKIVFILANSADPGEMQHYAAFHLGLHCLPKVPV